MYRAVITLRGEAWLAAGGITPIYQALATLVSPPLEATHSRALFDVFCARLTERLAIPHSTDKCRNLWRALCDEGLIAVRGSMQIDAGHAFAIGGTLVEGSRPRWGSKRDGDARVPGDPEVDLSAQPWVAAAANLQAAPLIPHRVSDLFRDTLARLVGVAPDK